MAKKTSINQQKYDKAHCRFYGLKLNLVTDSDIITRLGSVPSMQGYIKQLIRDDIKNNTNTEEKTMEKRYVINFTDPATGAISPIDNITADSGYTAADYISDCRKNADPDYISMLESGTVSIEPVSELIFEGYSYADNKHVKIWLEDGRLYIQDDSGSMELFNEEYYTEDSDFTFLHNEFRKA